MPCSLIPQSGQISEDRVRKSLGFEFVFGESQTDPVSFSEKLAFQGPGGMVGVGCREHHHSGQWKVPSVFLQQ